MSSALAAATSSMVPTSSRCTGAMLVITPTSGSATRASSRICPTPRIAISTTATSVERSTSSSVSGTPISLLRLASVATVRATGLRSALRMSLVDVLPALPVMPTTLTPAPRRTVVARSCSALRPSSTTMRAAEAGRAAAAPARTTTAVAPSVSACAAYRSPSKRSPCSPMNRSPGCSARLSVQTRRTSS